MAVYFAYHCAMLFWYVLYTPRDLGLAFIYIIRSPNFKISEVIRSNDTNDALSCITSLYPDQFVAFL
jgi:hypothetical protein